MSMAGAPAENQFITACMPQFCHRLSLAPQQHLGLFRASHSMFSGLMFGLFGLRVSLEREAFFCGGTDHGSVARGPASG